ncbi:hypothetical protein CLU84_2921 [Comamonas sp. 26]|nr:hypothetical protein CLU84_2921 [Comamonas sp. 26]
MVATVAVKRLSNVVLQDYSGIRNTLMRGLQRLELVCFD